MRIVTLDELRGVFDRGAVLDTVRQALIDHASRRVQAPPPAHLVFEAVDGDCHVKTAHRAGAGTFAIKVVTGFYGNRGRGLPVNGGFVAVVSAETGAPAALILDEGWLTAWRTAAAVVLAVLALAPARARSLGVVGAGQQASLALEWTGAERPDLGRLVWAREASRAAAVASATGAAPVPAIEALLCEADIVVTATPSRSALFDARHASRPRLFIALGADMPGKQELPAELFAGGSCIVVDDRAQSLDHGDWGAAVRAGVSRADAALLLGDVLAGAAPADRSDRTTIVDLTGVAAADSAIADLFCSRLGITPATRSAPDAMARAR